MEIFMILTQPCRIVLLVQFTSFLAVILFLIKPPDLTAQTITYGDTVSLGNGSAFTWVETDIQNTPLRIGISLTAAAVNNPSSEQKSVNFPFAASDSLIRHALFSYAPGGHGPTGVYNVPHFDFHFYMISESERLTILHTDDPTPIPAPYMPAGFIPIEGLFSIYQMGVHFVDSLADELNGHPFDKTFIYGFYKGKMIFLEPMITREYLLSHPDTLLEIKQPELYQQNAYYPKSYGIKFDSLSNLYEIILTDFVLQAAVTSADNPQEPDAGKNYVLYQNFPNPFNPSTVIQFSLNTESNVRIDIYNMLGELVDVLTEGTRQAGNHSISWSPGQNISSGIYVYKMQSVEVSGPRSFQSVKKMLLIR
jgi:hypothetical protein